MSDQEELCNQSQEVLDEKEEKEKSFKQNLVAQLKENNLKLTSDFTSEFIDVNNIMDAENSIDIHTEKGTKIDDDIQV